MTEDEKMKLVCRVMAGEAVLTAITALFVASLPEEKRQGVLSAIRSSFAPAQPMSDDPRAAEHWRLVLDERVNCLVDEIERVVSGDVQ